MFTLKIGTFELIINIKEVAETVLFILLFFSK